LHPIHRQGSALPFSSSLQKKTDLEPKTIDNRHHHCLRFFISRTGATEYKTRTKGDVNSEKNTNGWKHKDENRHWPSCSQSSATSNEWTGGRRQTLGRARIETKKTQGASRRIDRDYTKRGREAKRNTQTKKENRERDRERRDREKRKRTQNTNSQDSIFSLQRPYSSFIKARKSHRGKSDHCLHDL
jgi:hypothetical protein